ncbi:MAG: GGDEF domain-containing protein [Pseudohongiellaceae bacterium]
MDKVGVVLSSLILRQRLETLSYEDSLTGLKNRRYFNELYTRESAIALRTQTSLSFIMVDLDHFKGFNDRFGHQAGDEALSLVADTMRARFRETDIVCRYGGEEFIAILPGATSADAEALADDIRVAVHQVPIFHENRNLGHLTLSAGIATWPEHCSDPAELLVLADTALYHAKETGRNRVCTPTKPTHSNSLVPNL